MDCVVIEGGGAGFCYGLGLIISDNKDSPACNKVVFLFLRDSRASNNL